MLLLLLSSLLTFSSPATEPGLVCSGLSRGHKSKCVEALERGQYFEPNALRVCGLMLDASPKLHCIRTIRDHYFDPQAIQVCVKGKTNTEKIQCLDLIKDKAYDFIALEGCKRMALGFFTTNHARMNCLRELPFEKK
jgi:hypothetical protein